MQCCKPKPYINLNHERQMDSEYESTAAEKNEVPDFTFRVIVAGSSGVGKTCFVQRAVNNRFRECCDVTVISDLLVMRLAVDHKLVKLQFWDTCGLEQYQSINKAYYRGADIGLVLYDVTREKSLKECSKFIEDLKDCCSKNTAIYLVGTKNDLLDKVIDVDTVKDFKKKNGIEKAYEVSAKTGKGVIDLVSEISRKQMIRAKSKSYAEYRKRSFSISRNSSVHKSSCC
eukprot:TRINITY_DN9011_c0_g1_i1.p1 TRINITY_DN9011_c0_g1~~TRINITY_DN9011_c0_g1_i1.p1  ORF type:complete len:229 (+),score=38.68 TRINITY_DN9011_c0_g1_i1:146-832(+)